MGKFEKFLKENDNKLNRIIEILKTLDDDEINQFCEYMFYELFGTDYDDIQEFSNFADCTFEDAEEYVNMAGPDFYDDILHALEEEEEEEEFYEAMSRMARIKRGKQMKRMAKKLANKRKLKMNKKADTETIKNRAKKSVINDLKKKFAKGKDWNSLSVGQKEKIENKISKLKNKVNVMSKKAVKTVRKAEMERLSKK